MRILERDRASVEALLRGARERDGRVADVCRAAGARLDGTDDLLVLCAIDDALARDLADAEHPLYRPISFRPRIGRSRPRPGASGPGLPGVAAVRVDVDRLLAESLDPLDELRWPGGGRPGIERIARGLPAWDRHAREHLEACLAAVRIGPEGRIAMQRRAARLSSLPREAALVGTLAGAVSRFAELHGASPRAWAPARGGRLDRSALEAIARTPDEADEARRRWLAAEAEPVLRDPHRLRVRSREASAIAGRAPPWTDRGPASLAEALDAWRRRFGSPHDLDRLETEARQARLRLAGELGGLIDDARAALLVAAGAGRRGARHPAAVLAAALDVAGAGAPPGADASGRPAVERLVAIGGLSTAAVEAALRSLSDAAA